MINFFYFRDFLPKQWRHYATMAFLAYQRHIYDVIWALCDVFSRFRTFGDISPLKIWQVLTIHPAIFGILQTFCHTRSSKLLSMLFLYFLNAPSIASASFSRELWIIFRCYKATCDLGHEENFNHSESVQQPKGWFSVRRQKLCDHECLSRPGFIKVVQRWLFFPKDIIFKKFVLHKFLLFSHKNWIVDIPSTIEQKKYFFKNLCRGTAHFRIISRKLAWSNKITLSH